MEQQDEDIAPVEEKNKLDSYMQLKHRNKSDYLLVFWTKNSHL